MAAPVPAEATHVGELDGRTVITVLTHDQVRRTTAQGRMRLPQVAYVGAMGSRHTHDDRQLRLREAGLTAQELSRPASPIGLDLGARTPEETAISIAAEIIATPWGGSGQSLRETAGRIHRDYAQSNTREQRRTMDADELPPDAVSLTAEGRSATLRLRDERVGPQQELVAHMDSRQVTGLERVLRRLGAID